MHSSISSDKYFKKKNNYTVPLPTEKTSQVTCPPSQTAAKAGEQKKKLPLTAYSAKERLEKVERTQWGMNSLCHNRAVCEHNEHLQHNNNASSVTISKSFFLFLTLRVTSLLLQAVVNSRLKWENSCRSKGSYRSWRRRVLYNTASVMP